MSVYKCKMCGGELVVTEDTSVCECLYCNSKQTVPTVDNEKLIKLYERANRFRMANEFDKAAGVYESIIEESDIEAEAYWGLILCKYGIEYVDDPATGDKIPTCHRVSFDSVMEDEDLEHVMENADALSRSVYREQAKQIEEIRKGIIEVSGKESPYDIFICYKETAEDGDRTIDSVIAQEVYDALTEKGYRVFFSRISLEDKLGTEYEPYIFAALNSAKIMLAFGTSYDYYNAVWVKNEWGRYLKLMAKDKGKHLIPCFKDIDAYDIPKEFKHLQAQDMGKVGATQDLLRGIDKIMRPESLMSNKVTNVTNAQDFQAAVASAVAANSGNNINALSKRGFMAIEDGDWDRATEFFEQVLNTNPEDSLSYWGELLAQCRCKDAAELGDQTARKMLSDLKAEKKKLELVDKYECLKEKYFFVEILTEEQVTNLFRRPFYYDSCVPAVERIIEHNKARFCLEDNKLYLRTQQYADDAARENINKLKNAIDEVLNNTLVQKKEAEAVEISKAKERERLYFEQLESAFKVANALAQENYEKNKEKYESDHALWEQEKAEFPQIHAIWEQEFEQKRMELEKWREESKAAIEQFESEKKEYSARKKELENSLYWLEIEKAGIEGIMASKKIEKVEKRIMDVRVELSHLNKPIPAIMIQAPNLPSEPVLRKEPDMINNLSAMVEKEKLIAQLKVQLQEKGIYM